MKKGDRPSFAASLREELVRLPLGKPCCMLSELSALTETSGHLFLRGGGRLNVQYRLDNTGAARRLYLLLKTRLNINAALHFVQIPQLGGRRISVLTLGEEEIEDILAVLPDLTKWANEITAYALDAALNHGKEWNGFKVVEGRSVRKYRDEAAVAEAAKEAGYKDIYRQSLIPLTEMQRLMGKDRFEAILGGLITKAPGRPTLVPKSDRRPAMNVSNAINEFYEIKEDI